METKLTIKIDKLTLERAKDYAYKHGKSLSKLVEGYLLFLTEKSEDIEDKDISPKVKELMGVLKVPKNFNYKEDIQKTIVERHLK